MHPSTTIGSNQRDMDCTSLSRRKGLPSVSVVHAEGLRISAIRTEMGKMGKGVSQSEST